MTNTQKHDGEHALFPPSYLDRLIRCNGSWRELQTRPPLPQSSYAARGSLLHEYVVRAYNEGKSVVAELEDIEDRKYVLDCLDYIETVSFTCKDTYDIKLEEKVYLGDLDNSLKDVWGTADVILYDNGNEVLHVIDWKFGKGVQVFAFKNPQGLAYLAGASVKYPYVKTLKFHVFQPTLDHVDVYETSLQDMIFFLNDELKPAIEGAQSENPTYTPSVHACKFCIAKTDCPARHKFNTETAQEVFKMYRELDSTRKVDQADIKRFLDKADELLEYISAIKKYARKEILGGNPIDGYKLVYGRSNRTYDDIKKAGAWLLENADIPPKKMFKQTLLGPAAMEKVAPYLKDDPEWEALIIKPQGKISLAKEGDKREEVSPSTEAVKAFTNFKSVAE